MKIACIGEAMVELSLPSIDAAEAGLGVAGDTLNTAIYLKRFAPELDVSYVSMVGRDALSDRIVRFMQWESLNVDLVGRHDSRSPGLYAITTDQSGERSFAYWRSVSAARELFGGHGPALADLADFDLIYLSAISMAILPAAVRAELIQWLRDYCKGGGKLAFDSNYRPALWEDQASAQTTVASLWRIADIALPSVDDEADLFGDTDEDAGFARLKGYGITAGALKRGTLGPRCFAGTSPQDYPTAATVVDSTAAGDSFNAGYLAAWSQGAGPAACLMAGHKLAAKVIGVKGAIIPRDQM